MHEETVFLETLDGVEIEAGVLRTDADRPLATIVIGHPHPAYGGDRSNHVVRALQHAAWELKCHSIAVNFRGVSMSGGEHDNGDAERLDLAAACELADMMQPEGNIVMAGYSFGAVVALNVTHPYISAWIALAPPVGLMTSPPTASKHHRPKFLFAPEHDQFTSPEELRNYVTAWSSTTMTTLPGVDHFIAVNVNDIAQRAVKAAIDL